MADKGIGVGVCNLHGEYHLDATDSPCPSCEDNMDVCDWCGEAVKDNRIDYVFMRKMSEQYTNIDGVTPICLDCSGVCTEYENVKLENI